MRKLRFIATIVTLVASMACTSVSQAQLPQSQPKDLRWSVEFGAKAYDRPGDDLGLPLITDALTNSTLFDSDQASDLGSTVGAEIKLNFATRSGSEWEVRAILADWEQQTQIEGDNLRSPFFTTPGAEPNVVDYGYDADYFSIEIMKRRSISPGFTLMFGPRFVSMKDRIEFAGSLPISPGGGLPPVTFTQTQSTEATNALIGLQGGLELNFPVSQSVYLNSFIRTGGYMNPTEVIDRTTTTTGLFPVENRRTKSTGSFLGEVGGRVYVDLIPNCVATYAGYEATWIDGAAVAPAQLLNAGSVDTANTPFFHAVTFGLNMTY